MANPMHQNRRYGRHSFFTVCLKSALTVEHSLQNMPDLKKNHGMKHENVVDRILPNSVSNVSVNCSQCINIM